MGCALHGGRVGLRHTAPQHEHPQPQPLPTLPMLLPWGTSVHQPLEAAMSTKLGMSGATSSPVCPHPVTSGSLSVTEPPPRPAARARHVLSADGFLMYLCSPEGSIFNPRHQSLWQDMSQPLCHYFISSSHNTYLIEDQIRGQSSIEGYIR